VVLGESFKVVVIHGLNLARHRSRRTVWAVAFQRRPRRAERPLLPRAVGRERTAICRRSSNC